MRVLCCLDGTNVGQVSKAITMLWATQPPTFGILYVTDTGPRHDIDHIRERFLRPLGPPGLREHEMQQAEHAAAQDILNEGLRYLPNAETLQRQGRPEREKISGRCRVRFAWQLFDSGTDIFQIQSPLKLLALVSGLELIQDLSFKLEHTFLPPTQ